MVIVPTPVVEVFMPIVPPSVVAPAPVVVTLTAPPTEVALMPTPFEPRTRSVELTVTALLCAAVALMPLVRPAVSPASTSTITSPAPEAAVLVALMPVAPEPMTLAPA